MSDRPTGTITFLFTDVEGSTKLWDSFPEHMRGALARHDEILRQAIAERQGVVFSTAGDSFAAAFHTPMDGVLAAASAQLALAAEDWGGPTIRVRMGLHSGSAQERDGDYFGPTLNRAARIMSAGHGGQVLLSEVTAEVVAPDPLVLDDLGTHHLKDLSEPQHLFAVLHPDLERVEAALRTVDVRRDNLPANLTTFIGREAELAELAELVAEHRLVVLTGVGGTGKTRLATEAVRTLASDHPDGVWLAELAPVTNPAFIMATIGDVWGLRAGEGMPIDEVVLRHLYGKSLILLIDNCEHLLDGSAAAIRSILDACPTVRIVATSRESLGIRGEAIFQVPSLGLPDGDHALVDTEAGRLFLDRAEAVRPGFEPTTEDLRAIERIVTRIDGIPLGIELAAARLRSLSPADLADRLEHSFRILAGSSKTALPRQRTLQATIDWSHDLLKPEERAVFRRLATFIGGFDLQAAEAVAVGDDVADFEVLDHLDSLVDKSLVLINHDTSRYRMLEPVRQYAQEQLAESHEASANQDAHARYFAGFAATASPHIRGPRLTEWNRLITRDYENLRAALTTFLEAGEFDSYIRLALDLSEFWMHTSKQIEAIEMAEQLFSVATPKTDPLLLIKLRWATAIKSAEITRPSGIDHARAGLALAHDLGDPNAVGRMELALGAAIRHATTDPEYLEHLHEGRRLLTEHPKPHWAEPDWDAGLIQLLLAAYLPGDDEHLESHFHAALDLFERTGDEALLAAALADTPSLWGRADTEWIMGNLRRAVEILERVEVPYWLGHALQTLGILTRLEGDNDGAIEPLAAAATLLQDMGDLSCWATSSRALARVETALGATSDAARRVAAVIDLMPALPMQEVAIPRTLDTAAEVLAAKGDLHAAARVLGRTMGIETPPSVILDRAAGLDSLRERLTTSLGDGLVEQLIGDGNTMSTEDALELARTALRS